MKLVTKKLLLGDILAMMNAFTSLRGIAGSAPFGYAVAYNRRILQTHVAAIQDASHQSKEAVDFERARHSLALRLAAKDSGGQPIIDRSGIRVAEPKLFEEEMARIIAANPSGAAEAETASKIEHELLTKEVDVSIVVVQLPEVPNGVPVHAFDGLMPMIDGGELVIDKAAAKPPVGDPARNTRSTP